MYKEKLTLTNKRRVPFSLSNHFDDTFGLIDGLNECETARDFRDLATKYSRFNSYWNIDKDDSKQTRLIWTDRLGNVYYLIAYKENNNKLSGFTDRELIEELKRRGFEIF